MSAFSIKTTEKAEADSMTLSKDDKTLLPALPKLNDLFNICKVYIESQSSCFSLYANWLQLVFTAFFTPCKPKIFLIFPMKHSRWYICLSPGDEISKNEINMI